MFWRNDLPLLVTYPLVRRIDFCPTARGWRDHEEMAEFLGLSTLGFYEFRQRSSSGPKHLTKRRGAWPVGSYTDQRVAEWVLTMSAATQSCLGYCQHTYPAKSIKDEARASVQILNEAQKVRCAPPMPTDPFQYAAGNYDCDGESFPIVLVLARRVRSTGKETWIIFCPYSAEFHEIEAGQGLRDSRCGPEFGERTLYFVLACTDAPPISEKHVTMKDIRQLSH